MGRTRKYKLPVLKAIVFTSYCITILLLYPKFLTKCEGYSMKPFLSLSLSLSLMGVVGGGGLGVWCVVRIDR